MPRLEAAFIKNKILDAFDGFVRRVCHCADQYRRARWPALLSQTFEVSYKRRLGPRASSRIEKETLKKRIPACHA